MKSPKQDPAQPKKPYQSPKLFVYGDLTEMTKTMFLGGRMDMVFSFRMTG
jgi:hypothetical protein